MPKQRWLRATAMATALLAATLTGCTNDSPSADPAQVPTRRDYITNCLDAIVAYSERFGGSRSDVPTVEQWCDTWVTRTFPEE